ncbi:unnamed protein product [Rotaria sordida]|uniref:Uncharacterized protein n=1 Tax=Rotaria sordida TaxID=392033 RepID=A0A818IGV4_9BILA|nr:unnamed protein product [Rotaria sordida]
MFFFLVFIFLAFNLNYYQNIKVILTFDEAQSKVNSSIQYALEQQLKPNIISSLQLDNPINIIEKNGSIQVKFLLNNYVLTVSTAKSNYFATLDETNTQISASQNDGPVPLAGAITMYPELIRTKKYLGEAVLKYSNSTIQVIVDFLINFSTSCDNQLINKLKNLTNTQIHIRPVNITDGQVSILKGDIYVLYDYSLTTQVIANFTGTIIHTIPSTLTIAY